MRVRGARRGSNVRGGVAQHGAHWTGEWDTGLGLATTARSTIAFAHPQIGLPNAGKSTLLRAITRAKPKVAAYPFTTLKPHLGMVEYDDYVQISIADLPGLIPGSHLNKGLGIQFLKHAERCAALMFILDASAAEPWTHFEQLQYEISQFSEELAFRPQIIVANKIDRPEAAANLVELRRRFEVERSIPVVEISAKIGTNVAQLLGKVRTIYDRQQMVEPVF